MQENNDKNQGKSSLSFESLDILIAKWKDGTFSEIIDDWKWIFSYSVRYKWAIVFYTIRVYSVRLWDLSAAWRVNI